MRKRKSLGVPVQVYNIGAAAGTAADFNRDELWKRMDSQMGQKAVRTPVFLVNESQMDALYPPQYRKALSPEIVRELFETEASRSESFREGRRDIDSDAFFDKLKRFEERGWELYHEVVAQGLYLRMKAVDSRLRARASARCKHGAHP